MLSSRGLAAGYGAEPVIHDIDIEVRAGEINPMQRIGRPEDMVGVCVFLASNAASYVNGAQVLVDGGLFRTL